jgi:hypothetical protein
VSRSKPTPPCAGNETRWFNGLFNPARPGVYQRKTAFIEGREWAWSYWTGQHWCPIVLERKSCVATVAKSKYQRLPWRGVCAPQSVSAS